MLVDYLNNEFLTNLSKTDQDILQYLYQNEKVIQDLTIRELAKMLNVSTTTILRFCKKMNLSGYSELKYILKKTLFETPTNLKKSENTIDELKNLIENTLLLIREDEIKKTLTILNSDQDIHLFCGGGISGTVLDYWEDMLFLYGRQGVYRYESTRLASHIAESFTKKDVLFVISSSGTYEPTIKMVNLANLKGIESVAITPYTNNPIANMATINFRFFNKDHVNRNSEYNSRLPIFYIIDTIFQRYQLLKEGVH